MDMWRGNVKIIRYDPSLTLRFLTVLVRVGVRVRVRVMVKWQKDDRFCSGPEFLKRYQKPSFLYIENEHNGEKAPFSGPSWQTCSMVWYTWHNVERFDIPIMIRAGDKDYMFFWVFECLYVRVRVCASIRVCVVCVCMFGCTCMYMFVSLTEI